MSVDAFAALEARSQLRPHRYDPDPLTPGDVEVAITHCGICHSDLHLIDNDWGITTYPLIPGHEIIGTVSARGDQVGHLEIGQRVGVGWQCGSCMNCEMCRGGDENLCPSGQATCVGRPGGFATSIRVDGRFAFPIPERLSSENVAPLLCAGITTYSPLRHYEAQPQMKLGVVGIGGLGHLALQFASAFGCEVTAFSHTPEKEGEARRFGAHHFVSTADSGNLESVAGSLDFILSTVTVDLDWKAYLAALRPKGRMVIVGASPGPVTVPAMALIIGHKSIGGSAIGGCNMMLEMLGFAARHGIKAESEVMLMSDVNTALDRVRGNQARYRVVLRNG